MQELVPSQKAEKTTAEVRISNHHMNNLAVCRFFWGKKWWYHNDGTSLMLALYFERHCWQLISSVWMWLNQKKKKAWSWTKMWFVHVSKRVQKFSVSARVVAGLSPLRSQSSWGLYKDNLQYGTPPWRSNWNPLIASILKKITSGSDWQSKRESKTQALPKK